MSSLLSTYLLVLYLIVFTQIIKTKTTLLYVYIALINWILPLTYWFYVIFLNEGTITVVNDNKSCSLKNVTFLPIEESYSCVVSLIGVFMGILVRNQITRGKRNSDTNKQVIIYIYID